VEEGLKLPAKSEKLDSKVWRLNEAIQKAVKEEAVKEVVPIVSL